MRKLVFVLLVLVAFSPALFAQKVGIEAGYSFLHAGSPFNLNANGFEVQPMFMVTKHFAVLADFSGQYATFPMAGPGHLYTYLFGPSYVLPVGKFARMNVHYLFGGATLGEGPFPTENAFAMAPGGALDFKVAKHVWIRPAEVDYVITHFGGAYQDKNVRYGAGLLFMF